MSFTNRTSSPITRTVVVNANSTSFVCNDKALATTRAIGSSSPAKTKAAGATNVAVVSGTTTGACTTKQSYQFFTGVTEYLLGVWPETVLEELDSRIDVSHAACIGKGSFGDVISAHTRVGHQQVAVKVLPQRHFGDDAEANARIRHEVTTLRDLSDHANLIQIIGIMKCSHSLSVVSKDAPFVCIVMEYVADSTPLSQHIYYISDMYKSAGENGSLNKSDTQKWVHAFAVSVIGSVAFALAFMHQRGYVHRDVWSENILVSKAGNTVLCDLGSAERHDITECKRTEMNIPYMSPAAWQGFKQAPGDDCWALGLVLSEVVTGKLMNQRLAGNTGRPVHTNALALQELKRETAQRCPELSPICERMLSGLLRADMKEIAEQIRDHSICPALPDMSWETLSVSQATTATGATPSNASASGYAPSSVMSQSQISSLADLVISPPRCTDRSTIVIDVKTIENQKITIGAPKTQVTSPAKVASTQVAPVVSTVTIITSPGPTKPTSSAPQTSATASSAASGYTSSSISATKSGSLAPGMRVKYLARTNSIWYAGVLVGRLVGSSGWLISLDCGQTKEVDDRDSFRLAREA